MLKNLFEMKEDTELFSIECENNIRSEKSYDTESIDGKTIYKEIIKFDELTFRITAVFENDEKFKLYFQLKADWKNGIPKEVKINLGFLSQIFSKSGGENQYYFSADNSIFQMHRYFLHPLWIVNSLGKSFSIKFENQFNENWIAWDQNRGMDFIFNIKNYDQLKNHKIVIRPSNEFTDIFILDIEKINGGISECFKAYRESERAKLDLSIYDREELKWYRKTILQHFTYMFGKEAFDYNTNKFKLDSLLEDGEEFGGYDSILLWHQYPRLGVDERTQWEFFDDFPGGRAEIKRISELANKRGVKVFLPFKPWDIDNNASESETTERFANLIKDTGVNGMFFDTMTSVPETFRKAADEIDKSFAFCTEGKPRTVENLQQITGSWDQFWNKDCTLEINIARYILPENAAPMISRWHLGESRDNFIKRAIWNGSGLVIWQDVFGAWLPFSDEQKAIIKKWKEIISKNTDIYFGKDAIPLIKTCQKDIYCNYFSDGKNAIYSIYNKGENINSSLVNLIEAKDYEISELFYGRDFDIRENDGGKCIFGEIGAGEIVIVKCADK